MNASFRNGSIRAFNSRRSINRNSSYTNCSFRSRMDNRSLFNQNGLLQAADMNSSIANMSGNSSYSQHARASYFNAKNSSEISRMNKFRLQEKQHKASRDSRSKSSSTLCKDEYKKLDQNASNNL